MSDDTVEVFEEEQEDGSIKHGFLCDGSIIGLPYEIADDEPVATLDMEEADEDLDNEISLSLFHKALQDVLPDGEAIIITEVGWEKMRYLHGCSTVITKSGCKSVDLREKSLELARDMLGNPEYTTQMEY